MEYEPNIQHFLLARHAEGRQAEASSITPSLLCIEKPLYHVVDNGSSAGTWLHVSVVLEDDTSISPRIHLPTAVVSVLNERA